MYILTVPTVTFHYYLQTTIVCNMKLTLRLLTEHQSQSEGIINISAITNPIIHTNRDIKLQILYYGFGKIQQLVIEFSFKVIIKQLLLEPEPIR